MEKGKNKQRASFGPHGVAMGINADYAAALALMICEAGVHTRTRSRGRHGAAARRCSAPTKALANEFHSAPEVKAKATHDLAYDAVTLKLPRRRMVREREGEGPREGRNRMEMERGKKSGNETEGKRGREKGQEVKRERERESDNEKMNDILSVHSLRTTHVPKCTYSSLLQTS